MNFLFALILLGILGALCWGYVWLVMHYGWLAIIPTILMVGFLLWFVQQVLHRRHNKSNKL